MQYNICKESAHGAKGGVKGEFTMGLFEGMAYVLLLGVIAAAYLPAMLANMIGFGSHQITATILGVIVGTVILLSSPTQGVLAMVLAAVVSLVASIVLDKLW